MNKLSDENQDQKQHQSFANELEGALTIQAEYTYLDLGLARR